MTNSVARRLFSEQVKGNQRPVSAGVPESVAVENLRTKRSVFEPDNFLRATFHQDWISGPDSRWQDAVLSYRNAASYDHLGAVKEGLNKWRATGNEGGIRIRLEQLGCALPEARVLHTAGYKAWLTAVHDLLQQKAAPKARQPLRH